MANAEVAKTSGTFGTILKSSALIGGASLINVVVGALRNKALAVLLGPAGIGLMGAFTMILELSRNIAQLGLTGSGVRQIAEAASSGDQQRLALTATVLRRTTLLCAALGAIALWMNSGAVSRLTFGNEEQASSIALLSFALFLWVVEGGQGALLQGMRRMKAMAQVAIYGALLGGLATVAIVYSMAERGIVPSLVAAAIAAATLSWWYGQQVRIIPVSPRPAEIVHESTLLFKLGLAFLGSGLLMAGAAYAVRTLVLRTLGLDAAGMYQASWTLGGLYVGFVLQALGMDFYPRLVGVINDHHVCNITVNEQTQASLLLAAPGIIATITFAPVVVFLFYSAKFEAAVLLLRWICLGMAMRVITWPMGYIIVAKNKRLAFLATELIWASFNVGATWWCLRTFGLGGAGVAFILSYVLHALVVYPLARSLTGFRFTAHNIRASLSFLLTCWVSFVLQLVLPQGAALVFGIGLTVASTWYCLRALLRLTGTASRWPKLRSILDPAREVD